MEDDTRAETGSDGTLRWFRHETQKVYVRTMCSWKPCSAQFVSEQAAQGRYCSPSCRMKGYRARKKDFLRGRRGGPAA